MSSTRTAVRVEGVRIELSNLEKVLYPRTGFTKGAVIDYYARIAPVILPHLEARALTLKRYPDGVEGDHFYQKECPTPRPDAVETFPIWSERRGRDVDYCVVENLATLVWLANLATLELHTYLARVENLEAPTVLVFDLDPGAPATVVECAQVALDLRELLDSRDLASYAKTSGSKGLQVYVPLNSRATFTQTKTFARAVASVLERAHPERVTANMSKGERHGRVLIDWSQNDAHKTTVCAYSLRARPRPTVSTPLAWDEIEDALQDGGDDGLTFGSTAVLDRVDLHGDLFRPVLDRAQSLPPR